ncbi:MAG: hypothetical protein DRQ55_05215 [Planctomycetota bacterium]|nr:MAG: hypothetical protein DRQ55_05215 [Planctomycetota bacterium]
MLPATPLDGPAPPLLGLLAGLALLLACAAPAAARAPAAAGAPAGAPAPNDPPPAPAALTLVNRSIGLDTPTREEGRTEFELGDVNGDGNLDIVSVGDHGSPNVNSAQHGITLYLGDGQGSWAARQFGTFGYGGCALGDLDLDGDLDLAWGIHHDWTSSGLGSSLMGAALSDGTGTSWTNWSAGLASNGESWGMFATALADFDGDGDLDLASLSFGGGNGLQVYRNNLDGSWTPAWSATGGSVGYTIEACDVNADGYLDIIASRGGSNVYLGDGAFGFSLAQTGLPTSLRGLHHGDMDNDGDLDLVLCEGSVGVRCFRFEQGSSSWSAASSGLPTTGSYELSQLGDLNGDGLLDIVAFDGPTGRTFLGDGAGNWSADASWSMPSPGSTSALRVDGDVDHDGREDIVIAASKSGFPFYRNQLRVYSPWQAPASLSARVSMPHGGEVYRAGCVRRIDWLAAVPSGSGPASVELQLSLNGAAGPWQTLAGPLPDNGRWQWTVPQSSSDSCRVKLIVTTGAGSVSAISPQDFAIVGDQPPAALSATPLNIPEAGGTVDLMLDAGSAFAGRSYVLLGTASGSAPGTPLPGGLVSLPLNFDWLTFLLIDNLNTPLFTHFSGVLDASGRASAQLNLPPVAGAAGLSMHYAFLTRAPYDFVSNAVQLTFVP